MNMRFLDDNGKEITLERAIHLAIAYHPGEVIECIFRYLFKYEGVTEIVLDNDTQYAIDNEFEHAINLEDAMGLTEGMGLNSWKDTAEEEEIKECLHKIGWINLKKEFKIDCDFDYWLWPRPTEQAHNLIVNKQD